MFLYDSEDVIPLQVDSFIDTCWKNRKKFIFLLLFFLIAHEGLLVDRLNKSLYIKEFTTVIAGHK